MKIEAICLRPDLIGLIRVEAFIWGAAISAALPRVISAIRRLLKRRERAVG